jgi:hypothetical protein
VAQFGTLGATAFMETTKVRPTPASEIAAFFLCGSVLNLVGAALLGLFATMGLEPLLPSTTVIHPDGTRGDAPEVAHGNLVIVLIVAPIVAIGLTTVGFFVAKRATIPFWYVFITGIIPGFLLFQGWAAVHAALAAKKGLQVSGLRRVIIITAVVGLFVAMGVFRTFYPALTKKNKPGLIR